MDLKGFLRIFTKVKAKIYTSHYEFECLVTWIFIFSKTLKTIRNTSSYDTRDHYSGTLITPDEFDGICEHFRKSDSKTIQNPL